MRYLIVALLLLGVSPRPQASSRLPTRVESLDYPPLALQARISGDVMLEIWLNAEGRVLITDSGALDENGLLANPSLRQAAIDNIVKWQFQPGPEVTMKVIYHFKLVGPPAICAPSRVEFDFPNSVTILSAPPVRDH